MKKNTIFSAMPILALVLLGSTACNKDSLIQGIGVNAEKSAVSPLYRKGSFQFQNVWKLTSICITGGSLVCVNSTSRWVLQGDKDSTGYAIKDTVTGNYMVEYPGEILGLSKNFTGVSAFWTFVNYNTGQPDTVLNSSKIFQLRNSRSSGCINVETGLLQSGAILPGWLSAQWKTL